MPAMIDAQGVNHRELAALVRSSISFGHRAARRLKAISLIEARGF
jgi:hypothetical protein